MAHLLGKTSDVIGFCHELINNGIKIVVLDFSWSFFEDKEGLWDVRNMIFCDKGDRIIFDDKNRNSKDFKQIVSEIKTTTKDIKIMFVSKNISIKCRTQLGLDKIFEIEGIEDNFVHYSENKDSNQDIIQHYINKYNLAHRKNEICKYLRVDKNPSTVKYYQNDRFGLQSVLKIIMALHNVTTQEIMYISYDDIMYYSFNCSVILEENYECVIRQHYTKRKIYNFTNYLQYSSTLNVMSVNENSIVIKENNSVQLDFAICLRKNKPETNVDIIVVMNELDKLGNNKVILK